jgi:hypothetical protein
MSEAQTLGEAVRSANSGLTAKHESGTTESRSETKETRAPEKAAKEAPTRETTSSVEDDEDYGAPKWTKQWKQPTRDALRKLQRLAKDNDAADAFNPVFKEIEDRYDYTGKNQAEYDRYKKRYDPYDQVLGSLEQRFAMQGVHPQAGLQQMAAVSELLQRDPDQALSMLASQFRPRDVKAFIQNLAQNYGVDLGSVAAAAPWIDPAVKQMIEPLQQQNQYLMQNLQLQHQQRYQQASSQVASSIQAFVEAKDENGEPKHPHYWRLDKTMAKLFQAQPELMQSTKALDLLYEQAMYLDPELREQMSEDRARKAEATAIKAAKSQTESTEEAVRASRNVNGSRNTPREGKGSPKLLDVIKAQNKKLTNR